MKSLIALIITLSSANALACIPSGEILNKSEKTELAADLQVNNPACLKMISRKLGKLTTEAVSVFEDAQDMLVRYSIRSRLGQMKIDKVRVMGKIRYQCSPVTGVTRGC